jgi:hypothetical protein
MPARDKLCLSVRGKPQPCIASVNNRARHLGHVPLLGPDEAPDFVNFRATIAKVAKRAA